MYYTILSFVHFEVKLFALLDVCVSSLLYTNMYNKHLCVIVTISCVMCLCVCMHYV